MPAIVKYGWFLQNDCNADKSQVTIRSEKVRNENFCAATKLDSFKNFEISRCLLYICYCIITRVNTAGEIGRVANSFEKRTTPTDSEKDKATFFLDGWSANVSQPVFESCYAVLQLYASSIEIGGEWKDLYQFFILLLKVDVLFPGKCKNSVDW